ncbi:hypothetical protein [Nocardioides sp. TF02-7]|uniref:hypothetical protein n=1 Tax=Nocardioides sp. TF02-7 TaxID=2917724 RepID=UPI001F06C591|nr:hypothetical protein [Nocardioides sp. TF02-7]UMG94974.1 hypothetical protein MF408_13935 [Nocardioides sp. TF02-7]
MDQDRISDIIEIEQLLARYAVGMTQHDVDTVLGVFAPGRDLQRLRRRLHHRRLPDADGGRPAGSLHHRDPLARSRR